MIRNLRERFVRNIKYYFFNVVLIWFAIFFYRTNKYYVDFLRGETQITLFYLALSYTIFGIFYYIIIPIEKVEDSKGYVFFKSIKKIFRDYKNYVRNFTSNPEHPAPKLERHEKNAILFLIVKIFFLPIMINFFFANYVSVSNFLMNMPHSSFLLSVDGFNTYLFSFFLSLIFMVDTLYFAFGYSFESRLLGNKLRSVEPTFFGWFVALVSYPPFNGFFSNYVSWYSSNNAYFYNGMITFFVRVFLLVLLLIYVSATVALGTKCSNLTNRGIVSRGPYRFVRHPAYIGKNLFWWITIIPVMSVGAFMSALIWSVIYYFRAITEERHLIMDPDYQAYCRRVRWRFVPWVW